MGAVRRGPPFCRYSAFTAERGGPLATDSLGAFTGRRRYPVDIACPNWALANIKKVEGLCSACVLHFRRGHLSLDFDPSRSCQSRHSPLSRNCLVSGLLAGYKVSPNGRGSGNASGPRRPTGPAARRKCKSTPNPTHTLSPLVLAIMLNYGLCRASTGTDSFSAVLFTSPSMPPSATQPRKISQALVSRILVLAKQSRSRQTRPISLRFNCDPTN